MVFDGMELFDFFGSQPEMENQDNAQIAQDQE
jgi:hypothetical protein